jgi:hypothetical protein
MVNIKGFIIFPLNFIFDPFIIMYHTFELNSIGKIMIYQKKKYNI